jgi:hypothetical protein
MVIDKNKEKLKKALEDEITKMFESILDYVEVAIPGNTVYKALRSKILRSGNNCIRTVKDKLEQYDVKYIALNEEIIEIKQR